MRLLTLSFLMLFTAPCYLTADEVTGDGHIDNSAESSVVHLRDSYQNADKNLNAVYDDLIGKLGFNAAELKESQLRWIKFKENHCGKFAQNAKDASIIKFTCLAALTEDRVNELKRINQEITGKNVSDEFTKLLAILVKQGCLEGKMIVKLSKMYTNETDWNSYLEKTCGFSAGSMRSTSSLCRARLNFLRSY